MEKLLNPYDKECMRMAILKHEETFKEQVYELHRLYQIQKILMKNIANTRHIKQEQARWNFKNSTTTNQNNDHIDTSLDPKRPANEHNVKTEDNEMVEIVDESELELTLGPCRRRETRVINESSEKWRVNVPISNPSFLSERKNNSKLEERLMKHDRLNNNSPWLFQALSLNMT